MRGRRMESGPASVLFLQCEVEVFQLCAQAGIETEGVVVENETTLDILVDAHFELYMVLAFAFHHFLEALADFLAHRHR